MQYLKTYLKTITDRGNPKLAESISKTAEAVGSQHQEKPGRCLELCARRLILVSLHLFF